MRPAAFATGRRCAPSARTRLGTQWSAGRRSADRPPSWADKTPR